MTIGLSIPGTGQRCSSGMTTGLWIPGTAQHRSHNMSTFRSRMRTCQQRIRCMPSCRALCCFGTCQHRNCGILDTRFRSPRTLSPPYRICPNIFCNPTYCTPFDRRRHGRERSVAPKRRRRQCRGPELPCRPGNACGLRRKIHSALPSLKTKRRSPPGSLKPSNSLTLSPFGPVHTPESAPGRPGYPPLARLVLTYFGLRPPCEGPCSTSAATPS